jgi:DNA primase
MNVEKAIELLEYAGIEVIRPEKHGEILCRCPFHEDSTPSMWVNAYTGKYLCFAGCASGYSIDDLIFRVTGKKIENRDEIDIDYIKKKLISHNSLHIRQPCIPILPLALDNKGYDFLFRRGIDEASIRKYNIMWWEENNSVVIKLHDVGFVERYIDTTGKKSKYHYISGTRINDGLFGYETINKEIDELTLVEGCLDSIYLSQLGMQNTLALLHADISDNQQLLLKNSGIYKINVMMDNDEGGEIGASRIISKLKKNFLVYKCELPENKDPNDCKKEEILKTFETKKLV